jgi:hypothetical protein
MGLIYLVEISPATDASGTVVTLRATTSVFYATKSTDTPANTPYLPIIKEASLFRRDIASPGRVYGANTVGYGFIDFVNADGSLDAWLGYSFNARACKILVGEEGAAYSTFVTVFSGVMDQLEFPSLEVIRVRIRDRLHELDKVLLTTKYAGTNSLPSGLEGVDDLKGKFKPRVYGNAWNVGPPCVNTSRLIYQLSDQALYVVVNVYDKGVALTAGSTYSSQSDMETNAPSAGQYRAWLAGGMVRLGSTPSGRITAHVKEVDTATGTSGCPGSLIKDVAVDAGIAAGDVNSTDVSTLNTACAHNDCGYFCAIDDQVTALQVMDYFASSAGAWYGFDRLGSLRMKQVVAPSAGASVYTFQPYEVFSLAIVPSNDGGVSVPVWSATCEYLRNWTPMNDGELASGVTLANKPLFTNAWQKTTYSDATVKTKHLKAVEYTFSSATGIASNAAAEAQRREELLEAERSLYSLRVRVTATMLSTIDLGAIVQVNMPRFSMSSKAFLIVGILHDPIKQTADITLWG